MFCIYLGVGHLCLLVDERTTGAAYLTGGSVCRVNDESGGGPKWNPLISVNYYPDANDRFTVPVVDCSIADYNIHQNMRNRR